MTDALCEPGDAKTFSGDFTSQRDQWFGNTFRAEVQNFYYAQKDDRGNSGSEEQGQPASLLVATDLSC